LTASDGSGDYRFATTRWTVVLAAGREESTESRDALRLLCQTYWFPLYVYLRRWGCDVHQAEDCTQAFFEHLIEKQGLRKAKPGHSRFRAFLLASLWLSKALELDPAYYPARKGRALASYAVRNYATMATDAEAMVVMRPKDVLGYALRAIARREAGQCDMAM